MPQSHVRLLVHVIFSTKDREPLLSAEHIAELCSYIGGVVRNEGGTLLAAGGVADHLHLLIALHPSKAVADLVRDIKANSSRWIKEKSLVSQPFAWQAGYGAFSVSESGVEAVRAYIAQQPERHRSRSFREEYLEFLERHRIDYDPAWVFGGEGSE